jgi:hypothetical protein
MARQKSTGSVVHQTGRLDCLACDPGWPFHCQCGGVVHGQRHPTVESVHEVCDACDLADSWASSHNAAREQLHGERRGRDCMCAEMPMRETKPHAGEENR